MEKVTLKEIAALAGLSVATVSKSLNNSSEIKFDTKEKVLKIAKDLNYDFESRNIERITRTRIIGIICPEIVSNYYARLVDSLRNSITQNGYLFVLWISDFKTDNEKLFSSICLEQNLCGLITITACDDTAVIKEIIAPLRDNNVPTVVIATDITAREFDYIQINDSYGIEMAVSHLVSLGHRDIAYIGDELTNHRQLMFCETLVKNGLEPKSALIRVEEKRFLECGYEGMRFLLKSKVKFSALFAAYDDVAIGAMRAATEAGKSIPGDISVIGFDNISVCSYLGTSLTTVAVPIRETADAAVDILPQKIEKSQFRAIRYVEFQPELIIRETTCPVSVK